MSLSHFWLTGWRMLCNVYRNTEELNEFSRQTKSRSFVFGVNVNEEYYDDDVNDGAFDIRLCTHIKDISFNKNVVQNDVSS